MMFFFANQDDRVMYCFIFLFGNGDDIVYIQSVS